MYEITILKKDADLFQAYRLAQEQFDLFFGMWQAYISRVSATPLREYYAAEGMNAWLIRIDLNCSPEQIAKINAWLAEQNAMSDMSL